MKRLLIVLVAIVVSYFVLRSSYRPQEFRAQSPPAQLIPEPNAQQPSVPAEPVAHDTCDGSANQAAYSRVMRAHEYRNISHAAYGDWSGGVWRATGDDCTTFSIVTTAQWNKEQQANFINTMLGDLCTYGFKTININGFPTTLPCETQSPTRKRKPHQH